MKRALLILVPILLLALGIGYWISGKHRNAALPQPESAPPSSVLSLTPVGGAASTSVGTNTDTAIKTPGNAVLPPVPPDVSPTFVNFLVSEAKLLDSTHVDVSAAEERMNEQASAMHAPEIRYIRALVLSRNAPGNERVLAMGILTSPKANFSMTLSVLGEVINAGMNSARAEPHSVDEITNAQAKAFAIMAVDAIADRAVKDPVAREELKRMAGSARDSTVQKYIFEKIRGLPPL